MKFTRRPVVQRFFAAGIIAFFVGLGFGLFAWLAPLATYWPDMDPYLVRKLHAQTQIGLFAGFFVLGFALQSGPHVLGGPPPPARAPLPLIPWLLTGHLLMATPLPDWVGAAVTSGGWLYALKLFLPIFQGALPERKGPIGTPFLLGFISFALFPWLDLTNPGIGAWASWAGVVSFIFAAGQQLIANVLGGHRLEGKWGWFFTLLLLSAWLLAGVAALDMSSLWWVAGLSWLLVAGVYLFATGVLPVLAAAGLTSLAVTLWLGFLWIAASGLLLLAEQPLDAVLHALAVGGVSTLIMGVAARVITFFSARHVLGEPRLIFLILLWQGVALVRVGFPLGWFSENSILVAGGLGFLLFSWWGTRMLSGIARVMPLVPQEYRN